MISMTFAFSSYEEAIDALRGIKTGNMIIVQPLPELSVQEPAAPVAIKTAKVEAPKPVKAEKPAPTPAAKETATPKAAAEPAAAEPVSESPSEVTYKQVADAVTAYSKKATRPVAAALLGKFGVAALPQAKPQQYEAILAAFEQALEEHEAELV